MNLTILRPVRSMVAMRSRCLADSVEALCFTKPHKIAMVSGPRQCGKTTMARMLLATRAVGRYYNWDEFEFRHAWAKKPSALIPPYRGKATPLVVLDEIHKDRFWKRNLKGLFDTQERPCDFLVTGSARLNIYRRGSDSLLGRYFHFRLHPFTLREMERVDVLAPDKALDLLFSRASRHESKTEENLASLMSYGPFPEPLFGQDARAANLWRRTHDQIVIREDLRDISRLPDLGRLELMTALLPERVGSLFSVASLREDLEVSFDTVRRWVTYLKELYYTFEIKPWSRSIPRSLRREGKIYLWDYAAVPAEAARFENLVASHLLKACHYWTDTGEGTFELFYLRNKEKQEIDFLIVRDGAPWLPVEVKLADTEPSPNWRKFAGLLPCKRGLQLVRRPTWKSHEFGDTTILVAGAAEALGYFA
ncbi:MAG: ATP-binding protein [Planctomycetota bacterium]